MECHSIIRFPEIQELVLSHLDAVERRQAALVCKGFYATICHLEREMSVQLDNEMLLDDKIYESIMQSSRRIGEIVVTCIYYEDYDGAPERYVAVVKKFKEHMKSLVVQSFPPICDEVVSELLNEALEVEKLVQLERCRRSFAPKQQFTRLRHLEVFSCRENKAILDKISDNSLETLKVVSTHYFDTDFTECLSSFVARQKKLKTLELPRFSRINLDHLNLKQLETFLLDDSKLAGMLKNQHELQGLIGYSRVGKRSFEELRKMTNLELLEAHFIENVAGEFPNLKKLGIHQNWSILPQLACPNLEELMVEGENDPPTPGVCEALHRSSPNLQHLVLSHCVIEFLPLLIQHLPTLKTLCIDSLDVYFDYDIDFDDESDSFDDSDSDDEHEALLAPSRKHRNLEELIIRDLWTWAGPMATICETINACPELKRIYISDVPSLSKHQVLSLIQHHPHLTHFRFEKSSQNLFDENDSESGTLDPVLEQIINIFKRSPAFVLLAFSIVIDCCIENFVADQITVKMNPWHHYYAERKNYKLKLVKKSNSQDPFRNFHKKKELRKEEDWEYSM